MGERDKGFLEKIGIFIPGYKGYSQREGRRSVDKLLRESFCRRLFRQRDVLDEKIRALSEAKTLENIEVLDRARNKLIKITDKLRFAIYGASGFFDLVQIKEEELEKIYNYDLDMAETIELIEKKARETKESMDPKSTRDAAMDLIATLNGFDVTLDKRQEVVLEVK